jgi:hypothetical protein
MEPRGRDVHLRLRHPPLRGQPRRAVGRAQRALRRIAAAGLLVLGTDYLRAGDHATAARSIADACAAGALPFLSDIELTRIPATPARCQPSRGP